MSDPSAFGADHAHHISMCLQTFTITGSTRIEISVGEMLYRRFDMSSPCETK